MYSNPQALSDLMKTLDKRQDAAIVCETDHYNQLITNDKRNTNMLIPIRDGLMLCFKNE